MFHIPTIPNGNRNCLTEKSQGHYVPSGLTWPLPMLDPSTFSENNREESQIAESLCTSGTTLGNALDARIAPV